MSEKFTVFVNFSMKVSFFTRKQHSIWGGATNFDGGTQHVDISPMGGLSPPSPPLVGAPDRNTNNLEKRDFFVAKFFFDIFLDFDPIFSDSGHVRSKIRIFNHAKSDQWSKNGIYIPIT